MSSSRHSSASRRRHSDPNVSWQRPANSRCLVCGRLDAACTCNNNTGGGNLDTSSAQQQQMNIKAALDHVASNTPFGRSKAQRVYEHCCSQEAQGRSTIDVERHRVFTIMQHRFGCGIQLMDLQASEQRYRERGLHLYKGASRDLARAFLKEWNRTVLFEDEAKRRREMEADHALTLRRIKYVHKMNYDVVALVFKESLQRVELVGLEMAAATRLHSACDTLRRKADEFVFDCQELERVFFAIRQEIQFECASNYRAFMNAFTVREHLFNEHLVARTRFHDAYSSSLRDLEVTERTDRGEIRRVFFEELHEVEALLERNGEERKQFCNSEAALRGGVRSDEAARFRALCDFEVQCREQVQDLVFSRALARMRLLEEAVADMRQLGYVESSERDKLFELEQQDRDLAQQLMEEKALARERLGQEALRVLYAIDSEESMERNFIEQRMVDHEVLVQMRIESNETELLAFVASEEEARRAIRKQREADLTSARLAIEERETQIFRLLASRHAQRVDVEELESDLRCDVESHEEGKRAFILSECRRLAVVCGKRLEAQRSEREHFLHEVKQAFRDLGSDEQTEFDEMMVLHEAECNTVEALQFDRECNHLFDTERRFRHKGTVFEFEERQQIAAWFQSVLREAARADQERVDELFTMLDMEEACARDMIRSELVEESSELASWGYRSERAATEMEQSRLERERFERARELQEEATNPELFEPLVMSDRLSLHEVRRSVSLAPSSDRELKINYLSQLLRRDDLDQCDMSDSQLDFLSALLEASAQRRAEREANHVEVQARMRAREKDLHRAETLERSRRDAAEHYKKKLDEEQMRQNRTLENEKALVQRVKKQAKIEEMRMNEMSALLKKKNKQNDALRDQLHAKMARK